MTAGVTIAEMQEACRAEACRLEQGQAALVAASLRAVPDEGELRRARIFEAVVLLLDVCRGDPAIMGRLRAARVSAT
jgi:hypothetical protein